MSELEKHHVEDAFALYNTGARIAEGHGKDNPKKWVVRNPKNGDIYPAKTICALAYIVAGVDVTKGGAMRNKIKKFGFEFFQLDLEVHGVAWTHTSQLHN